MVRSLKFLACTALAGALYGVGLYAQESVRIVDRNVADLAGKMVAIAGSEMERIIKNAPFAAQATTTTTQVLGDGNRIVQTQETALARDSEGRTRREMPVNKLGPWSTDATGHVVVIRDPVAQIVYEISPDGQHASSNPMPSPSPERLARQKAEEAALAARGGTQVSTQSKIVSLAREGGGPAEYSFVVGGLDSGPVKKEALGDQTMEGVRVTGTRETRTIAAGKIGNERPIDIVSETWYSPDLQMVVQSRHSDPRVGETVYRLTNVVLGEPDASLFQLPAGVTVTDRKEMKQNLEMELRRKLEQQGQPQPPQQ